MTDASTGRAADIRPLHKLLLDIPAPLWSAATLVSPYLLSGSLHVKQIEGTLTATLISSQKSLIRWGDGESRILMGRGIGFQDAAPPLRQALLTILQNYVEDSTYLLAMPVRFLNMTTHELAAVNKLYVWRQSRFVYKLFCTKRAMYGDSLAYRPDKVSDGRTAPISPEPLWRNAAHLVLVHNKSEVAEQMQHRYPQKRVYWVSIPAHNAFAEYDNIRARVLATIEENKLTRANCRLLISMGPAAKVLIYELCERYICYDLGSYFEWESSVESDRRIFL